MALNRPVDVAGALEQLWGQAHRAEHVGLVLTGRLKVTRAHARRELIIDLAGPDDVIGEVALGLRATDQFDARCLRRAQVLLVPSPVFRRLRERRPAAATALAIDLAQQLVRLTRRLEALGAGDVEHRLARDLVRDVGALRRLVDG